MASETAPLAAEAPEAPESVPEKGPSGLQQVASAAAAGPGECNPDEAQPLTEEKPDCAEAEGGEDNEGKPNPLDYMSARELAAIRARHHAKYRARREAEEEAARKEEEEAEERRLAQEKEDAELAAKLAQEEEQARLRQTEADEEYSRQLAQELHTSGRPVAGAGGHSHSYGGNSGADGATGSEMVPIPLDESDSELGGHYHQMADEEGYRPPMRTGYTDRLIEPAQDLFQALPFQQLLLAAAAGARGGGGDGGRAPLARGGGDEAGDARELGLGIAPRCAGLVATALPVACLGALFVMLVVLMMQGN